ncbi:TetR/AcrR family transcriptional regulator [Flaviflexus equikiangi]|uniref:TetR/AcrR family transcriptional regulator n=1 Tax=Flaviflexus equikiangi TaxID=2758573 RepID=A0ABS2TDE6_9ACTO|nr:TetR/AcrR family transcriptional regulator [Flaviflexus equikiangi]MBM9432133.1 TetR/AcrR family transcriptional regulator [Flaviflexus equikiangi]
MGRPQAFDTDAVVRSARNVFWRLGYESTSVPDLEAATGLNRSSIYHAFGSKRGLFDTSVESYLTEVVRPRLEPLTGEKISPRALVDYLVALRSALAERSALASHGCMLINTAGARIGQDEAVREAIAGYQRELRAAFLRGLQAAHPELDDETADLGSRIIASLVITALALTRADFDAAMENVNTAIELAVSANTGGSVRG